MYGRLLLVVGVDPNGGVLIRWLPLLAGVVALLAVAGGLLTRSVYRPVPVVASPGPASGVDLGPAPGPLGPRLSIEAAGHPRSAKIRSLLLLHFESINTRNYEVWKTTVVNRRIKESPERIWREQLAGTKDGSVLIHRVEPAPGEALVVLITFVSTQRPDLAPTATPLGCLRWNVVYSMVRENGALRLDSGQPNSSYSSPC